MRCCTILNSRKRVVVALVHNMFFFGVAAFQIWRPPSASSLLAGIYGTVAAILAVLAARSGAVRERLYFACCMGSAALGLVWQILGDRAVHPLVYVRVILLGGAALIGFSLLRAAEAPTT